MRLNQKSGKRDINKRLYDIIYSPFFEILVIICIFASVSLLVVETSTELDTATFAVILSIELALNVFFIIEYVLRISIAPSKWVFFKRNLIDFIALLPILRFFRMVRILRLVRVIRIFRSSQLGALIAKRSATLGADFQGKMVETTIVALLILSIILVGSVGILIFEQGHNEHFENIFDGFWWSVVTLTTVGYGDKFPITAGGRILAIIIMLFGLSFFALITGFVSSFIIQRYRKEEHMGIELIGVKDHIIVCGWNANASTVVDELVSLYKYELKHCVVIAEEQPDYIFSESVHYVKGDFTRRDILDRAQIEHAAAVIVLADTTTERTDQDIDARTILSALAIEKISSEIYTCVEILSPENVEHVINAGVDEYVSSANYTGNLLAHSVKNPGITAVYNELLRSTEGNQIYKTKVRKDQVDRSFNDCAIEFLKEQCGILIGVERDGEHLINPKELIVLESDILLRIARTEAVK